MSTQYSNTITLVDSSNIQTTEKQYFWFLATQQSGINPGVYITGTNDKSEDVKSRGYFIDDYIMINQNGLQLAHGLDPKATVSTDGLTVHEGGIISSQTVGTDGGIYLSTLNYGASFLTQDTDWRLIVGSKFGVRSGGQLYASAGQIAGWTIDENSMSSGSLGASNSVIISTGTNNSASIGGSATINNWVFTADNKFGVTKTGNLYASSVNIKGVIDATSFQARDSNQKIRAKVDANGLTLYKSDGTTAIASFNTTVQLGQSNQMHVTVDTDAMTFQNANNTLGVIYTSATGSIGIRGIDGVTLLASATSGAGALLLDNTSCYIELGNTNLQLNNSTFRVQANAVVFQNSSLTTAGKLAIEDGSTTSLTTNGRVRINGCMFMGRGMTSGSYTQNHGIYSLAISDWIIELNAENTAVIPQAGAKTTDSAANMRVTSGGGLYRSTASSKRYKTNIQNINSAELNPHNLYQLPVRQFKFKPGYLDINSKRYDTLVPGFIAEEVNKYYPIATDYNEEGMIEDWNFRYLIPPMLKLIQEQHQEIEQLKKEIMEIKTSL